MKKPKLKKRTQAQTNSDQPIYSLNDFREFRKAFKEREMQRVAKLKTKAYKAETFERLRNNLRVATIRINELNHKVNIIKSKLIDVIDGI